MNANTHRAYQFGTPLSPQHQRGMLWFWNLSRSIEETLHDDASTMLRRSQEFYNLYAQTGEHRYLTLCEAFLRNSLSA